MMKFFCSLFFFLLITTIDASILTRLSRRLASAIDTNQAETTTTTTTTQHAVQTLDYGVPIVGYTWDNLLYTEANGGPAALKVPSTSSNIILVNNAARGTSVLSRSASVSQANSKITLPASLSANSPFTIAIWINWGGVSQPNQGEAVAMSTDGDVVKLAVSSAGIVTGTLAGASISAGSIEAGIWTQFTLVYDGTTFYFYRNGQLVGSAATAVAFSGTSSISLLNNAARTSGWIGLIDTTQVFTKRVEDQDIAFLYTDTQQTTAGQAPVDGPDRWWGHTFSSTVSFANEIQSQPTGDITLSGSFIDSEFRATNQLYYTFYGVTGPTNKAGVNIDYQGTKGRVTWDEATNIFVFTPSPDFVTVPVGATWTFTIPGSALNLNNPGVTKLATANDPRWMISQYWLSLDQTPGKTRRQALKWQGIQNTPITINNSPAR